MIDVIAFDADDTLWHNEIHYSWAQERLEDVLAPYHRDGDLRDRLYETELGNMTIYGYGTKAFGLSMIETAVKLAGGEIKGDDILQIIRVVKTMLQSPVELLDHVADVIPALAARHKLIVITKGDLHDQERKIARSGLAPFFAYVEVVSDKTVETYRSLFDRLQIEPRTLLMVGNSLRSDILPVVALGGCAVHIPYAITWQHEHVPAVEADSVEGYVELEHMGLLPDYVDRLESGGARR